MALRVAASLLGARIPCSGARIMAFIGGPSPLNRLVMLGLPNLKFQLKELVDLLCLQKALAIQFSRTFLRRVFPSGDHDLGLSSKEGSWIFIWPSLGSNKKRCNHVLSLANASALCALQQEVKEECRQCYFSDVHEHYLGSITPSIFQITSYGGFNISMLIVIKLGFEAV